MKTSAALAAVRSDTAGISWPPISSGTGAVLTALLHQLEDTQWLAPDELARNQMRQFEALVCHCHKHSPAFRARLERAGLAPADLTAPHGLARLPPLVRRDVQSAGADFFCDAVPEGHGATAETRSSGSTGEPVIVKRTMMSQLDWLAMTVRDHLWWGRDFSGREAAVRAHIPAYIEHRNWGPPANILFDTGMAARIPVETDIAEQARLLRAFAPDTLLLYPSNLLGLVEHCRERGITFPSLTGIRTLGETLWPHVREEAEKYFAVRVDDCYSSQEVGYVALQCPEAGLYHIMETVLVEILGDDGAPVAAGEIGRVTVTDLHNFATPIIRYDIGDYAVAGGVCSCGRGLPTLARIVGRERNLVLLPDGRRFWPFAGIYQIRDIAPIRQYQIVQHTRERMEVRLVVEQPLTAAHEEKLRALLGGMVGHDFAFDFTYVPELMPKGPGGKFEQFMCKAT